MSTTPSAMPESRTRTVFNGSESVMVYHRACDRGFDTHFEVGEQDIDADVAVSMPGPLGGVGEYQPVGLRQDRRVVSAGIGDNSHAGGFQGLGDALLWDLVVHPAAGVDVERRPRLDASSVQQLRQMVKLRNREVGRADADGRQLSVPARAALRR